MTSRSKVPPRCVSLLLQDLLQGIKCSSSFFNKHQTIPAPRATFSVVEPTCDTTGSCSSLPLKTHLFTIVDTCRTSHVLVHVLDHPAMTMTSYYAAQELGKWQALGERPGLSAAGPFPIQALRETAGTATRGVLPQHSAFHNRRER